MVNNDKLLQARDEAVSALEKGIGTRGEKLLHRTLKYYLEPDSSYHEKECFGSIADIRNNSGIIEIQTRSFGKLVPKLERFLPEEKVTVVYPVIENKYICRIDTETGVSSAPRKSPKRGKLWDALSEISMIRRFIPSPNLTVLVVMVDITETRLIQGKIRVGRKVTDKIDAIPTSLNSVISLSRAEDYRKLIPEGLPEEFTSEQFERISGLRGLGAHGALMLLLQLGIFSRERKGREPYVYTIN